MTFFSSLSSLVPNGILGLAEEFCSEAFFLIRITKEQVPDSKRGIGTVPTRGVFLLTCFTGVVHQLGGVAKDLL